MRRTLSPLLAARRAAPGVGPLRILDPAVGDGAFLAGVARLLSEHGREAASALLCGIDIDPAAVQSARRNLGPGILLMQGDALASSLPGGLSGGFHAVIGNPPWGGWSRRAGGAARGDYAARFETARGVLEPSALFVERATSLLGDGGRLGLVLPDYLLLKAYPALRRHLLACYRLEEMIHWGRVFPGVNLDAFTLVARRDVSRRRSWVVACFPDGPGGRRIGRPQRAFEKEDIFNLAMDDDTASLLGRLTSKGVALGELLETHEGIHSGNVRGRLFVPPGNDGGPAPTMKPLILGRDEIRPFALRWRGWRVRYDRRVVRGERGEYASLGRERWFTGPKILVRRTGDRLIAALDRDGLFASNNLFVALPRPALRLPLEYLEAWLNSAQATWCFRAVNPRAGRLFAELKLKHLNRLPVPVPRRRAAVDRVVGLARRMRSGNRDRTRRALERAFARIAGLGPKEVRLVESHFYRGADSL